MSNVDQLRNLQLVGTMRIMEFLMSDKKLFYLTEEQALEVAKEFVDQQIAIVKQNPEMIGNMLINQGIQLKPKN